MLFMMQFLAILSFALAAAATANNEQPSVTLTTLLTLQREPLITPQPLGLEKRQAATSSSSSK